MCRHCLGETIHPYWAFHGVWSQCFYETGWYILFFSTCLYPLEIIYHSNSTSIPETAAHLSVRRRNCLCFLWWWWTRVCPLLWKSFGQIPARINLKTVHLIIFNIQYRSLLISCETFREPTSSKLSHGAIFRKNGMSFSWRMPTLYVSMWCVGLP